MCCIMIKTRRFQKKYANMKLYTKSSKNMKKNRNMPSGRPVLKRDSFLRM